MKKAKFDPIIRTTDNYSMFSLVFGNRKINYAHVKRIKQSMSENCLFTPIIVNNKFQIIDGQHRFMALSELQKPVHYIVVNGYGKTEVQIYNVNNSNWRKTDYLKSFMEEGNDNYIRFNSFMTMYPDLSMSHCIKLLSGYNSTDRYSTIDGIKTTMKDFESGNFVIKDIDEAHQRAKMILEFKPFFKHYNHNAFVLALLWLFDHPEYNHAEMIKKVSWQEGSLKICKTKQQYIEILEAIYNNKRHGGKVNLRFKTNANA